MLTHFYRVNVTGDRINGLGWSSFDASAPTENAATITIVVTIVIARLRQLLYYSTVTTTVTTMEAITKHEGRLGRLRSRHAPRLGDRLGFHSDRPNHVMDGDEVYRCALRRWQRLKSGWSHRFKTFCPVFARRRREQRVLHLCAHPTHWHRP